MQDDGARPQSTSLDVRRRALHDALSKKNTKLATIFEGAIIALEKSENPERLPQCAHSLRELIEKLPQYLDLPTKASGEKLGPKVNELHPVWEQGLRSASYQDGAWEGAIDKHLRRALLRLGEFFVWHRTHMPRRRAEAANALRAVDPSRRTLPSHLEALVVDTWEDLRTFFQAVAHHGRVVDDAEFLGKVDALESLLLERLVPRTFSDQEEIDAIIREAKDA
jgi:hypothetical protein